MDHRECRVDAQKEPAHLIRRVDAQKEPAHLICRVDAQNEPTHLICRVDAQKEPAYQYAEWMHTGIRTVNAQDMHWE